MLAAALAAGVACTDTPPTALRTALTHLHFHGSVSAASTSSDITSLITALGGNSDVPAFYDARNGITLDTTGGVKTVSAWADARGGGFGPTLVPVMAGKTHEPKYNGSSGPVLFSQIDSTVMQTTSASSLFDLSKNLTLIYDGSVTVAASGWGDLAISSDTANPPARGLGLGNIGHPTVYGIGGASRSININTGVHTSGTGLASDTGRMVFLTNNGSNGAGVTATVVDTTTVNGSGGTAPGSGNNYLTVGAYHQGASGYAVIIGSPSVNDVIVLNRLVTALDRQMFGCWGVAKRGLTVYSTPLNCPTTIKTFPATATISTSGGSTQLTDTVYNVAVAAMTPIGAVTWTSSNTAVSTVSAAGLVTAVGNGTDTITASTPTWQGIIRGTSVITVSVASSGHPNEPSGMTAVVDVGHLTVAPATVFNGTWTTGGNVPASYAIDSTAGQNLKLPTLSSQGSGGDTVTGGGYRVNWATSDPDSAGDDVTWWNETNSWSTNGTGWLYVSFWVRLPSGASYGDIEAGDGFKIIKLENSASGSNPIMDIVPNGPNTYYKNWGPLFGLQTAGAYTGNIVPNPNSNPPTLNGFIGGSWEQVEMVVHPNSTAGSTDGSISLYLAGTLQVTVSSICIFPTGTATPFKWLKADHYVSRSGHGAGTDVEHNTHTDIDQIYVSVK